MRCSTSTWSCSRRGSARDRQGSIFPAYDEDGGFCSCSRHYDQPDAHLSILGIVVTLLVLALLGDRPGTLLSKDTKLGLDLEGGIELVYEARPTPQVPEVTQQAIDDAIETMRKRVDSLGVAEPEIQRSGREQIAVGLPSVQNAERAKAQVGTTARLQFYDWEPNVLTQRETYAGGTSLYDATEAASRQQGRAEKVDVVPGSGDTPQEADEKNNTAS